MGKGQAAPKRQKPERGVRKLASAALGFALGAGISAYLLKIEYLYPCAIASLLLCLPALLLRGSRRTRALIIAVFCSLGITRTALYASTELAPIEKYHDTQLEFCARVTSRVEHGEGFSRVYVTIEQDDLPSARVMVTDYRGYLPELKPGDRVRMKISVSSVLRDKTEKNYYYLSRDIQIRGTLLAAPYSFGQDSKSVLYFPARLAASAIYKIEEIFPDDTKDLACALLLGDTLGLNEDYILNNALTTSGLRHIVAVSGMHLTFLYAAVRAIFGKRRAAFVGVPAVVLYAFVAGCTPSVVRAAVMLVLIMVAPLFRRESDPLTSLGAGALLILAINPLAIASASFQLSFAAMLGIILISPIVFEVLSARFRAPRVLNAVLSSLAGTVGATAFTMPLTAVHFGYVSLVSPISNLLTTWAVSAAFLLSWLAVILGFVFAPIGAAVAYLASWLLRYVTLIAKLLSAIPFSALYTENKLVYVWLAVCALSFTLAYFRRGRSGKRRYGVALAVTAVSLAVTIAVPVVYYSTAPSVSVLDVGQGECVVVMAPGGSVVMDCGGTGKLENAGDTAADLLLTAGRRKIDVLALTHLHYDHANGVAKLLSRVRVETLVVPAMLEDDDTLLPKILEYADKRGTKVVYLRENMTFDAGDIHLCVDAPRDKRIGNESCAVMLCSVGEYDILVTGDISSSAERRYLNRGYLPDMELLVVGHHGSKYSTCYALLNKCDFETAVISVGINDYGHPAREVIDRLYDVGAEVFRTDLDGTVMVRITDGEKERYLQLLGAAD